MHLKGYEYIFEVAELPFFPWVAVDTGTRAGERAVRGARSEPAEVWTHEGRPVRFGWRGRLYAVLAVLERPDEVTCHGDVGQQGPAGVAGTRLRCWRVRASPGMSVPANVYRLCQDEVTGRWLLSRDSA